jgi:hypothetical protein
LVSIWCQLSRGEKREIIVEYTARFEEPLVEKEPRVSADALKMSELAT